MTTKYETLENDIKKFIIDKFKEIENYNNTLKDYMINNLYNNETLSYTIIRDKINENYYETTHMVLDFNSLVNKLKK